MTAKPGRVGGVPRSEWKQEIAAEEGGPSILSFYGHLVISPFTAVYRTAVNIYQNGANGCGFFSGKNLEDTTGFVAATAGAVLTVYGAAGAASSAAIKVLDENPLTVYAGLGPFDETGTIGGGEAADILSKPVVENEKLQNIVNDLYTGTTNPGRVGTGTTADAVRSELETGSPTGGSFHSIKATDYSNGLANLLKSGNLNSHDNLVAQSLFDDLQSSLGNGP